MDDSAHTSRGPAIVAVTVMLLGLGGAGRGFANGDAAAYAAQALRGDLSERTVHVGYLAIGSVLSKVVGAAALPWAMDALTALGAALLVAGVARLAGRVGAHPTAAAAAIAVAIAPLVSWAEVDLLWLAALVWAVTAGPVGAAVLVALAVSFSPSALLALPWVAYLRGDLRGDRPAWAPLRMDADRWRELAVVGGAAIAIVALLSVGSGGDWWVGERGVLRGPPLRLDRVLSTWQSRALLPGVLVGATLGWLRTRRAFGVVLVAPLVVLPADVPGWLVLSVCLALAVAAAPRFDGLGRALTYGALAIQGALAIGAWDAQRISVRRDAEVIRGVLGAMGPSDALVAEWTWGVRASVVATGDEYALTWRTAGEPVRDQAERWCGVSFERVAVLPPGRVIPGVRAWEVDPHGVHWARGEDVPRDALPGCR